MALIVAVYKTPKDANKFNDYYFKAHIPIAKKLPGLRSYQVSNGPVGLAAEPGSVHLVALLEFDSAEAIQKAVASPEGQATTGDLQNFADRGVDIMMFDTKAV
jgi:uncharacterized protein (TIGR02118 family)